MPLQLPEHFGTRSDGSASDEYCCYCYRDGTFTSDCTMDEMIEQCLSFLDEFNKDNRTRYTPEQARERMRQFFPTLKRWSTGEREPVVIRESSRDDLPAVMDVQKKAFGSDAEARLTAELLSDPTAEPILSLLALRGGEAVGHALFTKVRLDCGEEGPLMHILAPLAVVPNCWRQGIGGMLLREGMRLLGERGSRFVFVLGHKEYYPRHGFAPSAEEQGWMPPYPVPDGECWMVRAIGPEESASANKGRIVCCDVLNRPEYWKEE